MGGGGDEVGDFGRAVERAERLRRLAGRLAPLTAEDLSRILLRLVEVYY